MLCGYELMFVTGQQCALSDQTRRDEKKMEHPEGAGIYRRPFFFF